jgi:hypothetical protein
LTQAKFLQNLKALLGPNAGLHVPPAHAHRLLVSSLYNQQGRLLIGRISGVATATIAVWVVQQPAFYYTFIAIALIATARVAVMLVITPDQSKQTTPR